MNDASDNELIEQALKGDKGAFKMLFERYEHKVFNFAFRFLGNAHMAEEVVQTTFIAVYKNLYRYKAGRYAGPWIFKIARNFARNAYKRKKLSRESVSLDEPIGDDEEHSLHDVLRSQDMNPGEALRAKEMSERIQNIINALPEKYREVLILHDIEGMSYEDIQNVLNIPYNTAASRVADARIMLKKRINPKDFGIQMFFNIFLTGDKR